MLNDIIEIFKGNQIYYIIMFFIGCFVVYLLSVFLKKALPFLFKIIGKILVELITLYYKLSGNLIIYFRNKKNRIAVGILLFFENLFYIIPGFVHWIVMELKKMLQSRKKKSYKLLKLAALIVISIVIIVIDMRTSLLSNTKYGPITTAWADNLQELIEKAKDAEATDTAAMDGSMEEVTYLVPRHMPRYQLNNDTMEVYDFEYSEQECIYEGDYKYIDGVDYARFRTADDVSFYIANPFDYIATEVTSDLIEVSSYLSYEKDGAIKEYPVSNLTDKDTTTCWIEGNEDSGINETITFQYSGPARIDVMKIVNGFQISERSYKRNERVQEIQLSVDGVTMNNYHLEYENSDEFGLVNTFVFDEPLEVNATLTLTILGVDTEECVYTDTAISEIMLYQYR